MAGEWLAYGEISLAAMGLTPFALHRLSCGQWAKQQPIRVQKSWDNYEVEKGIYGFWKNKK